MTEFERKRSEFSKKIKDNAEKITKLASDKNATKLLDEVIQNGLETEEDVDAADAIVQLLIDMVDIFDDIENKKIRSSDFYKNKGIKFAIKYINAEKDGNGDSVVAELEESEPEEIAETVYGLMTSMGYLDVAEVFIRLKTGFEYDEEDDSKIREEYNYHYEKAYMVIMDSISKVYESGTDNTVKFAKRFHNLYGKDKFVSSMVNFFGDLMKEMQNHVEEMKSEESEDLDEEIDDYLDDEIDEDMDDEMDDDFDEEIDRDFDSEEDLSVIYIPCHFTPVREKWEELGFTFGYIKNGKYPVVLPTGWSLNEKNEFIDENGNKRGFVDEEEKFEAQLTSRYDVHVNKKENTAEVYFGDEKVKLYSVEVTSPTPQRLRLASAVVRQWAYENYPDWEDLDAYRDKTDTKDGEPKK